MKAVTCAECFPWLISDRLDRRLVPPGAQPGSYRLLEIMSAGGIPVFFPFTQDDSEVHKPFEDVIDWSRCSVTIRFDTIGSTIALLRAMPRKRVEAMRAEVLRVYHAHLDVTRGKLAETLLVDILLARHLNLTSRALRARLNEPE